MAQVKTLGGDRLGSGKKQKVFLHGYERSTHDLGYLWRSTMSAGTLVPFLCEVALPGDTFDINLNAIAYTHPTIGPLFGSYKVQLDVFECPMRLYQGLLHNNKLGIGMNMANVKLPQVKLTGAAVNVDAADFDNQQVNPSCIWSYLGIRGINQVLAGSGVREFNAIPFLAYWDIYKNYYANKQEEIGAVVHTPIEAIVTTVTTVVATNGTIPQAPTLGYIILENTNTIVVNYSGASPLLSQLVINTLQGQFSLDEIKLGPPVTGSGTITITYNFSKYGQVTVQNWDYIAASSVPRPIQVATFDLANLDTMREELLKQMDTSPVIINDDISGYSTLYPYPWATEWVASQSPYVMTQEGLAIKTYQSDLFNNWLSTEWIDGSGGINELTAVDTSGGSFTIDTLNLSKKVYEMLNRIAVSGGTYDDWLDAVYDHDRITRAETPIYHGGLSKELVFQEVISNSASAITDNPLQPLGTLAGRGTMHSKHKGGQVTIKVHEPGYIMGLVSLTPRVDYSQGNKWDVNLKTMDDLHKPALDEIGFQELITEQMAWWTTTNNSGTITQKSAGKQPAWINYMTNVNQTRGNFAIANNEMFMTLNRRYTHDGGDNILDLTTYIDPAKFNFIFAQTSLDSQNFWMQIAVDITARRKMSAKVMPNL